jgi:3-phenylpropionate/trans-cinnamate dioxygenase ferredoxin subunit
MPWIDAIPFDDIEPEDVIRWDHNGTTYALFRTEDEKVHLAEGLLMGHLIECPKHNGRFDIRDGSPKRAPVCVALRTYPARVEGGRILVDIPG